MQQIVILLFFGAFIVCVYYFILQLITKIALEITPKHLKDIEREYEGEEYKAAYRGIKMGIFVAATFIIALTSFFTIFIYSTHLKS